MGILGSPGGLRCVTLPQPSEKASKISLGNDVNKAVLSTGRYNNLINRFRAYFSGQKVDFQDTLDYSGFTSFQRGVWEAARRIPYGQTRSYGWVAQLIGKPNAARAVGQALGKNPFPIIVPCHRVLARDGSLGGFSGGLETKKSLLALERAALSR